MTSEGEKNTEPKIAEPVQHAPATRGDAVPEAASTPNQAAAAQPTHATGVGGEPLGHKDTLSALKASNESQFGRTDSFQENESGGKEGTPGIAKPRHNRGVSWDQNIPDNNRGSPTRPMPVKQPQRSDASTEDARKPNLPPRFPTQNIPDNNLGSPPRPMPVKQPQRSDADTEDTRKPNLPPGFSPTQNIPDNNRLSPPRPMPVKQPQRSDASTEDTRKSNLPPRFPTMVPKRSARTPLMVNTSTRNLNLGLMDEAAPLELEAENFLIELEAESALMRSLEDRDPMGPGANTGGPVLSGFPLEHLQHNFSNENDDVPHPTEPPPPTRSRLGSTDVTSKKHRRQPTVEQTLFGLTSALSAIHHVEAHKHNFTVEPEDIGNRERADTTASADRLAATADLLFKRANKASEASELEENSTDQPHSETGSTNRWGILKENLDRYKKTDALQDQPISREDSDIPDMEQGTGSDESGDPINTIIEESDGDKVEEEERKPARRIQRRKRNPFAHLPYSDKIKNEWDTFHDFLKPRRSTMYTYSKVILLYIWLPALGTASLLFEVLDNPPTGVGQSDSEYASASWWIILICIRETFLLTLAKCTEVLIIDFLSLQTRATLNLFGPLITLLIVQSKGWPFLMFFFGLYNLALIAGSHDFSDHWLFWQDWWGLFNHLNPSGTVTSSQWFYRVWAIAVGIGISVAAKRVAVGVLLGRQTFSNYSEQLARVMKKMLDISLVAALAKEIEIKSWSPRSLQQKSKECAVQTPEFVGHLSANNYAGLIASANAEDAGDDVSIMDATTTRSLKTGEEMKKVVDSDDIDPYTGRLSYSQRARISELLGRWEEPARGPAQMDIISISSVLQFRRALAHMDTDFPFSAAFGIADRREACITSAQEVYERLLLKDKTINNQLHFDTIAVLALRKNGELDNDKAKNLIRTFRPDRDGAITMVDFVRSIDSVYKELRMLRATVASASKIDEALENILNIAFYVILVCIILSQTGFDPLALFLSMSSVILAFAFMIGSASAKYFEGILFILVQRPYGIGDRINVSNTESVSSFGGAQGWIVDNVTLFTTTVYLAGTNERATVSNGNLAKSRIINGARSPKALLTVNMRFGLGTPYKKVEIFKSAVEKFVKSRPREWIAMCSFRASRIEAELGFTEYAIILNHRESWQNITPILDSQHTIHCYCLELAKKLDMRYKSPPLPIDLNMVGKAAQQFELKYNFEDAMNDASNKSDSSLSPRSTYIGDSEDLHGIAAMFDGK